MSPHRPSRDLPLGVSLFMLACAAVVIFLSCAKLFFLK